MPAWAGSAAAFAVAVASVLPASACAVDSSEHVPLSERARSSEHAPSLVRTVSSELVPSSGRVAPLHGSIGFIGSIGLTASPSHQDRSLSAPGSHAGVGYR